MFQIVKSRQKKTLAKSRQKKTGAEIQRAYRERKKLQNREAFLEKERKRMVKYFVPIAMRSEAEKERIREYSRQRTAKSRAKKKSKKIEEQISNSEYDTNVGKNTSLQTMVVSGDDPSPQSFTSPLRKNVSDEDTNIEDIK